MYVQNWCVSTYNEFQRVHYIALMGLIKGSAQFLIRMLLIDANAMKNKI